MCKCSTFPGVFQIPDMADSRKLRASHGQNRLCNEMGWKIVTEGPDRKAVRPPVSMDYFFYPEVCFMNVN